MPGLKLTLYLGVALLLLAAAAACGSDDQVVVSIDDQKAVSSPDGALGCRPGGVRVNDESEGRFNQPGLYRIHPYDDLKLEGPGFETIRLTQGKDMFVRINSSTEFKVSNWGDAGHVCVYVASTEERRAIHKLQMEQERAAREREQAARERQEQVAREREQAARERKTTTAQELPTDAAKAGIAGSDGRCGEDGFRINDESKARFSKGGTYRFYAYDDLKLDIDGRSTIRLPKSENVYVTVGMPADFEVHNSGNAVHACVYRATGEEVARERAAEFRTDAAKAGIAGPDGRCGEDGFRINDESKARFSKSGTYRFYAYDDLKLDIDGRSTIRLPKSENVYVIVDMPAGFEVHNWGNAGHACVYRATGEEAARERAAAQAALRARTDEQIVRECVSPWDGNHDGFERQVREQLNDPESMTTHATYYVRRSSGEFILRMDYGARNAFGGMVRTEAIAVMDTNTCEVTVLDYGFD